MTKLTVDAIRKAIKGNARIEQELDLDEPGKVIVHTADGWTWNALDGNRTVEGFNLRGNDWEEPDTLAYLKAQIAGIEPVR